MMTIGHVTLTDQQWAILIRAKSDYDSDVMALGKGADNAGWRDCRPVDDTDYGVLLSTGLIEDRLNSEQSDWDYRISPAGRNALDDRVAGAASIVAPPDAIDEATARIEIKPADGADGMCVYLYDKDGLVAGGYGETLANALSTLARVLGSEPLPVVTATVQDEPDNLAPGRKLLIDTAVYCTATTKFSGGMAGCDHDYDPKPTYDGSIYAEWRCTRCGGILAVELWE